MAIKTHPTDADVDAFLAAVPHARRRADGQSLVTMMREITGVEPRLWGPTMVGFGARPYTNTTGTNDWPVVGFSPRTTSLTIYGIWNAYDPDPRVERLGPHTTAVSCVYVKDLSALDQELLRTLIADAWNAPS